MLNSRIEDQEHVGLIDIDAEQHNHMLRLLGPHSAFLLIRVWCGCAMTWARRAKMDPFFQRVHMELLFKTSTISSSNPPPLAEESYSGVRENLLAP